MGDFKAHIWVGQVLKEPLSFINWVNGKLIFGTCLFLPARYEESSIKEQWHLPILLFPERAAQTPTLIAFALKPVNSVSPYMYLVLFELLPLHWSPE